MEKVYLISKEKVFLNWNGKETVEYTQYTYNESGNELTSENRTEDSTLVSNRSKEYDENGYLVKMTYMDEEGERITTYENNESGNVVTEDYYGETHVFEYTYDENGNRVKTVSYDANGVVDYQVEYEYDENGAVEYQSEKEYISMEIPKKD